jgi:hypothetical protein
MISFFFIKNRKIKHSIHYVFFYVEIERKKGRFIAVISMQKWYNLKPKRIVHKKPPE